MADDSNRIENKIDNVNTDVRELTRAIHKQSISIVQLCEQMKNSTEAVSRAHSRIDNVNNKVEELRDLPTRMVYLEKRMDHIDTEQEANHAAMAATANRLTQRETIGATLTKFSPWLVLGAVATALVTLLAIVGAIGKAMGHS